MSENLAVSESNQTDADLYRTAFKAAIASLRGMDQVEDLIKSTMVSDAEMLVTISEYLRSVGGKRMRPALCLLIHHLFEGESDTALAADKFQRVREVAAGIELIHMATLLHDDIIDHSPTRRHQISAYHKFGTARTLLTGDFLLVRAFAMCARLDDFVVSSTEQACVELTEGEILETGLHEDSHDIQSSLQIAEKKTAALFWLAACSAAHICTNDPKVSQLFKEFGIKLGIAFQILDDVLDVTSDEETLGKQAGTDLRERKPSMVNVLWLNSGAPLSRKLLESPCEDDPQELLFVEEGLAELRKPGNRVIQLARETATEYALNAQSCLDEAVKLWRDSGNTINEQAYQALDALVRYTLARLQ